MLNKNLSIYLDLVRIIATLLVFISHAEKFNGAWINKLMPNFGHDAVVIFFILSGFVIKYVAETKEDSLGKFFQARFIRIYSVVLPTLLLVFSLYLVGWLFDLDGYTNFLEINWLYILSISTFFLNEIHDFDVLIPNNGPFWSICYEVSYYVLFAIVFYTQGVKRVVLFFIFCVLIGFKILLLFPLWLMGTVVYKIVRNQPVNIKFVLVG